MDRMVSENTTGLFAVGRRRRGSDPLPARSGLHPSLPMVKASRSRIQPHGPFEMTSTRHSSRVLRQGEPRLLRPLLTSRSAHRRAASPFRPKARSPRVRTPTFAARPLDLRRLSLGHESFAIIGSLALLGSALYPVPVRRPAASLPASFTPSSRSDALRFTSLAVTSSQEDFHLQVSAHAGRTNATRPDPHRTAAHRAPAAPTSCAYAPAAAPSRRYWPRRRGAG